VFWRRLALCHALIRYRGFINIAAWHDQRLTSLTGCEVDIHLEIRARRPEGFDEATVRTISENSQTLKFNNYEFEP
jgi:hypothetical protein